MVLNSTPFSVPLHHALRRNHGQAMAAVPEACVTSVSKLLLSPAFLQFPANQGSGVTFYDDETGFAAFVLKHGKLSVYFYTSSSKLPSRAFQLN